jgi:hypothetical protein
MRGFTWLALMSLALSGCATKPFDMKDATRLAAAGSVTNGSATVYILRDSPGPGLLYPAKIQVDEQSKGWLGRKAYVHFDVSPGMHELRVGWPAWMMTGAKDIAVRTSFEPNRTYYFLFDEVASGYGQGLMATTRIAQISLDTAASMIKGFTPPDDDSTAHVVGVKPSLVKSVDASPALVSTASSSSSSSGNLSDRASKISREIGCGAVDTAGEKGFVAHCSGYDVAIDCDENQCRPTRTIRSDGT